MTNFENYYNDSFPVDFVYHAIISDSDAIDVLVAAHLSTAGRPWIDGKKRDGSQNSNCVLARYLSQLPFCSGGDRNLILRHLIPDPE